jgi:two-component system, OmpR family, response regulator
VGYILKTPMPKEPDASHHILVIDDSEVMLSRIKKALVADGHVVTTTTQTVGNARHLASCDLVIIDYHMPGIDGLSVKEALRSAASQLAREPLFYLYTSDASIAKSYASLGFDGSFTNKGDEASLVLQVRAVYRLSQIRAVAKRSQVGSDPPSGSRHRVSHRPSAPPPSGAPPAPPPDAKRRGKP